MVVSVRRTSKRRRFRAGQTLPIAHTRDVEGGRFLGHPVDGHGDGRHGILPLEPQPPQEEHGIREDDRGGRRRRRAGAAAGQFDPGGQNRKNRVVVVADCVQVPNRFV